MNAPRVTPWPDPATPTRSALWQVMADEGLDPYSWSNGPHDIYAAHTHDFDKVIYVVSGSITFGLPELGQNLTLKAGGPPRPARRHRSRCGGWVTRSGLPGGAQRLIGTGATIGGEGTEKSK